MLIYCCGDIFSHLISSGPSGLNGRIHIPVKTFLCPRHTDFPSYCTMHSYLLKVTVYPLSTSVSIEIKDVCASCKHICAFLAAAGSPGMSISPSCVVYSHPPDAFFNYIRFLVGRTFFNSFPGIQIVVVHPESAQACVSLVWSNSRVPNSCGLIVPCFLHSLNWCPTLVGLHFFLYNLSLWLSIVCCTLSICIIAFHVLACVGMLFCVGVVMFFIRIVFIHSFGLIPLSACFKCIRFSLFLVEILSSVGIFLVSVTLVVGITPMFSSDGKSSVDTPLHYG